MSLRLPLLAAVLLMACPPPPPGDDGGVPDDAGLDAGSDAGRDAGTPRPDAGFGDVPLEVWCESRATALCRRDRRCLRISDAGVDGCHARRLAECDQLGLLNSAARGRLQYLPAQAGDCLDGHDRGSCEEAPAACASVFSGLTPPDGGCTLAEDCTSEGHCFLYDGVCPHRCRGWVPLGGRCDGFSHRCRPGEGACEQVDAGVLVCVGVRDEGQPCPDFDSCRAELTCVSGQCVKRVARLGEPCGLTQGYPICGDEAFCRQAPGTPPEPGVCERKAGLGAVCTGFGTCLPSLRCTGGVVTGRCAARGATGERCLNFGDCEDGLFCHPLTQTCDPVPGPGGDCTVKGSQYTCVFGSSCDFEAPMSQYTCQAKRALGERCTYDGLCLSDECEFGPLPDAGFGGTCVTACSHRSDAG